MGKSVICAVEGAAVRDAQRGRQAAMGSSRWEDEPGGRDRSSRNGRSSGERYDDRAGAQSSGGSARGSRGASWDESSSRGGGVDRTGRGGDPNRSYRGQAPAEYERGGRGRPQGRDEESALRDRSVRAARPQPRQENWEPARSRGGGYGPGGPGGSSGRYRGPGGGGPRGTRYDPRDPRALRRGLLVGDEPPQEEGGFTAGKAFLVV